MYIGEKEKKEIRWSLLGFFTNDLQYAPANPFHLVGITEADSLLFQIEPSRTVINISFSS